MKTCGQPQIKTTAFLKLMRLVWLSFWVTTAQSHPVLDDRLAAASQAIEQQPKNTALLLQRSHQYSEAQQYQKAHLDLLRAYSIKPDDPEIKRRLGFLYAELGDFEEAIDELIESQHLQQQDGAGDINTQIKLAELYQLNKQANLSTLAFKQALMMTDRPPAHLYLATIKACINSNCDDSEALINKALNHHPAHLPLLEMKVQFLEDSHHVKARQQAINDLLFFYPNHPRWKHQ